VALPFFRIIHISDVHFGANHRFEAPSSDSPEPLAASLMADWADRELKDELAAFGDTEITSAPIIALTGDLTEVASGAEFRRAKHFLDQVTNAEVFGSRVAPEDVYVIPGNHDVDFDEQRLAYRWVPYCEFLQNWRGIELSPLNPHRMCRIVDRTTERNLIVAEINSCIHVEKDTKEEKRGRLDDNAVVSLDVV
jgi:predicted MPP superfamily phosphohydrolase